MAVKNDVCPQSVIKIDVTHMSDLFLIFLLLDFSEETSYKCSIMQCFLFLLTFFMEFKAVIKFVMNYLNNYALCND